MSYNRATLFAFLFILILGMGFAQVSTGSVSYERENKAVLSDMYGRVASVELTNTYTKVGSEMYLSDCGLTTCYLTLVITPDAPMDARTITGRVAGGSASYSGMQVYETRTISVPRDLYKTVEKTYLDNASKTIRYNETVFDRTIYEDKTVADWYPMDYASMDVGRTYTVRLEYHKANWKEASDLVPEIAGKRIDGWAWWASPNYTNRMLLNCSNMGDATLTAINGSGFYINGDLQAVYTLCYNNTGENSSLYLYYDATNSSKYAVANYTTQIPMDVVSGNGTSYNESGLYSLAGIEYLWSFETNASTQASRATANNIVLTGNVRTLAGKFGNGINATGVSGTYAAIVPPAGYAHSLWHYADGLTSTEGDSYYTGGTDVNVFATSYSTSKFYFQWSSSKYFISDTGKIVEDSWAMLSGSYNNVSQVGRLLLNATNQTSGTISQGVRGGGGSSPTFGGSNKGILDEYRIYNRYVSEEEIGTAYYNMRVITGYGTLGAQENASFNSAPVLASITLGPATIYKNISVFCEVNWTDDYNSTFEVHKGLAINGTIISAFNQTNTSYSNATFWNVSYGISAYTHGDKVSCWSFANDTATPSLTSATNYTANITIGNYPPAISNLSLTYPLTADMNAVGTASLWDMEGDTINCLFMWYRNGTNIYNSTQSPCTNTSTLNKANYSVSDIISFGLNATDSYGNATAQTNSSSSTVWATFTNNLVSLYPATLYKNTSPVSCAVNWTSSIDTSFTVLQGLTVNGTVVSAFNQTFVGYANSTLWNFTAYSIGAYTHGDKVSCWTRANDSTYTSALYYAANITISDYVPVITNVQISNPIQNGTNATGTADFWDYENDTINCRFEWFKNGAAIWNSSQSPCVNSSTLDAINYTVGDLINFTVYANDSFGGNATPAYSATINVSPTFVLNNYTWNSTQYGSVPYGYTINVTLPSWNNLTSATVAYNGFSIPSTCSNVSQTYYCSITGIPAPLTASNGTAINATWVVDYTDGITPVESNTTMPITLLYSVWATGINSSTLVAGGGPATVNVQYGNTAGITATLSGTAWLLSAPTYTGALTCAAGVCTGSTTTPSVSSATLYQVEANITLTSSYWGTTQNRVVRIEATHYATASNSTNTSSGTVTNPANGWDLNWSSYATLGATGALEQFNYTFAQLYPMNWTVKDGGATRTFQIPNDCIRPTVSMRVQRLSTTAFNYSCYNYSSEGYSSINITAALGGLTYVYEQNATRFQNNSLVKVVPFGLTDCTVGSPLIYYSCFDETTDGSLTCDYEQTFIINTTSGNQIQTFSGTDDNWTICFYPSNLAGNLTSTEEITAGGYDTRFFYIFGTAFNSSVSFNETRWAGPSATTKLTFVYVKSAGVGEPGVYVYVERLFVANNTFKTVGMGKTNDDGTAVVYLEPNDAFYKFVVVDGAGTVLYTSSTQQVGCAATASSCSVTLNIETSVVDFWDYQDGMATACTFDNTTKMVTCSFTVLDGTSHYFQLDVYRWAQFGDKTLNCTKNTTTASGTLWCDMGDASTTGTFVYYLTSYTTGLILSEGTINWMAVASWGTTGLFIALVLIVVLSLIGTNFGPSITILLGYVGLILAWLFQFVNVDLLGIVGLGVVAGALMYVLKH